MTIRAIILDIEGTIAPIAFVRDVLFPYARAHFAEFLEQHAENPAVAAEIAAVRKLAPGTDVVTTLLAWMDQDLKLPPLKALQGMVWHAGYVAGDVKGELYPDVAPRLQAWHNRGLALYIYSSGSVAAQKLLLGNSSAGNLCPLIKGYFDTNSGPKKEPSSYRAIATEIGADGPECLFLSDNEAELDAAATAGWRTIQVVRQNDGTAASAKHEARANLEDILL
jgi:enolase-phosphatase E1